MEEIKVNDYIRTPYNTIEKVVEIEKQECRAFTTVTTDISCYQLEWLEAWKTKHSPNIIDLIEEGDYVNGSKVLEVCLDSPSGSWIDVDCNKQTEECTFWNPDIKDVVTKEQFNQMKYIVGDE